jgi:TPR repeat protein
VKARELFKEACDTGYAPGCEHLGERIARGEGGERDWGAGLAMVADGCQRAHDRRCKALSELKQHPPDWQCATEDECHEHCAEQLWPACRRVVELDIASNGGDDMDLQLLEQACSGGDAVGCRMRGDVSTAFGDALPWYQRGCRLRNASACGYTQFARALHSAGDATVLRGACAKDRSACALYGVAIAKRDPRQAAKVWREACDAKVGAACRFLARTFDPMSPSDDDVMIELVIGRTWSRNGTCGCEESGGAYTYSQQQADDESRRHAESGRLLRLGCAAGDQRSCGPATDSDSDRLTYPLAGAFALPAWE